MKRGVMKKIYRKPILVKREKLSAVTALCPDSMICMPE
jgi:hypothetical protein